MCVHARMRARIGHRYRLLQNDTIEALLEPSSRLLLTHTVWSTNTRLAVLAAGHTHTWTSHADIKVHTENTNTWVILDTQVNVCGNTEAKVTRVGEVALLQLVLLNLQTALKNFLGLGTTNSDVAGNLFVTTDTEATQRVAGLSRNRRLTRQLFQHLGGTSETVTRLTDRDVDDELVNLELLFLLACPES